MASARFIGPHFILTSSAAAVYVIYFLFFICVHFKTRSLYFISRNIFFTTAQAIIKVDILFQMWADVGGAVVKNRRASVRLAKHMENRNKLKNYHITFVYSVQPSSHRQLQERQICPEKPSEFLHRYIYIKKSLIRCFVLCGILIASLTRWFVETVNRKCCMDRTFPF